MLGVGRRPRRRRVSAVVIASVCAVGFATAAAGADFATSGRPDETIPVTLAPSGQGLERPSDGWFDASAVPYGPLIADASVRWGVPAALVAAIILAESDFKPRAISPKGARGLMQLMPDTAAALAVRDVFDPRANIEGGVRHLRGLLDRLGDDLPRVLAAYNAGEQAVSLYGGIPPYRETRQYVARVLALLGWGPGAVGTPGGEAAADPNVRARMLYRMVAPDGTLTYTNIPPRASFRRHFAVSPSPR